MMRNRWMLALVIMGLSVGAVAPLTAGPGGAVRPAGALGDHMVLQRGKAVPIWGTAPPGEKVTVRFAGRSTSAAADRNGRWLVRLEAMQASTSPRELIIRGASGEVRLKDVLVGDVWIAGGQSNMGRDVRRSWVPADQRMDYPHIRFLPVRSRGSKYPRSDLVPPPAPSSPPRTTHVTAPNRWHVCTDRTTPECCAVGFFFAERIYKATGIPQGLLWNAWAGSVAREWIPRFGWGLRPELEDTARQVDAWYPETKTGRAACRQAVNDVAAWCGRAAEAVTQGHPFPYPQPMLPEPDDGRGSGRGTTILYNGRVHPLVPYAIRGILWYQGESDYANSRYLHEIEAMAESWRTLFAAPGEKPADLPFYFVQMQRCGSYMSPSVRDFQLQSYFTIPNAGMAVLLDLDMNLHPANKYDSGRRMALWALAGDYGKDVLVSGPLYNGHRTAGDTVVVEFAHAEGGLFVGRKNRLDPPQAIPGGKLVNLEITADGRQWAPAQSKIDGRRLIVWAEGISKPTDVRYCWKSKADEPFLYNKAARLPAAQFNTTSPYALKGRPPRQAKAPARARPARRAGQEPRREVVLSEVIGEQCVLQRGVKAPVWEHRNHSRRPPAEADTGGRWTRFKTPGKYFRNDGYHFGAALARATKAPVGVLALGASTLESMTPPEGFQAFEKELGELGAAVTTWTPRTRRGRQAYLAGIKAIEGWVAESRAILDRPDVTFGDLAQPPQLPGPPRFTRAPTTAYNFVIHRYTPAAFRGIVIQPKTFSAGDPLYLVKAKALIRGLREACGRRDLPVCFVQMHSPGRYEKQDAAAPDDWVRMRQAQNELAKIPNVTVVAAYDLKSPGRSEPDPGLRSAQWAAALVAGASVKTGPTYAKHRVDGGKVIVEFSDVGAGLMAGQAQTGKPVTPAADGPVGGFQLAGADGTWHDAAAVIAPSTPSTGSGQAGKTVVVSCVKVAGPAAVRYAWTPAPTSANLYNRAGFPALPFAAPAPETR